MNDGRAFASELVVLPDWVARRPITVADYYKMAEAGILGADERTELIEGQIIPMAPIGSEHGGRVNTLNRLLVIACGERAVVTVQNPVRLGGWTEPQPDFAVLKPRPGDYTDRHPTAEDVLLLVEVANSSLTYDMKVKAGLYARHGVAELWVIDVKRRSVAVHRSRVEGAYRDVFVMTGQDTLTIAAIPEITFRVSQLFP